VDAISPLHEASSIPKSARVLILAGEKDWRAPPEEAQAIHARVQAPCRLLIVPEAGHVRFLKADASLYKEAVLDLIEQCRK
jgi:pimeloyl-ACP methyl ester carboxylesterase